MDMTQYLPNLALVLVLYCVAEIAKRTVLTSDEKKQVIPFMCGIFGAVIAVAVYIFSPDLMSGCGNLFDAIICGVISGFAATGANQLYKQVAKGAATINDINNNSEDN